MEENNMTMTNEATEILNQTQTTEATATATNTGSVMKAVAACVAGGAAILTGGYLWRIGGRAADHTADWCERKAAGRAAAKEAEKKMKEEQEKRKKEENIMEGTSEEAKAILTNEEE